MLSGDGGAAPASDAPLLAPATEDGARLVPAKERTGLWMRVPGAVDELVS